MLRSQNPTASDFFAVCLRHLPEHEARVASELLFWSQLAEHKFRGLTAFYKEDRELAEKLGKHPKSVGRILRKFCALAGEDRPDALFIIGHGPKPRARSGRVRWLIRTPRGDEFVSAAQEFVAERLAEAGRRRRTREQNAAIKEYKMRLSVSARGPDCSPQNVATLIKQKDFSDPQTETLSLAEAEREKAASYEKEKEFREEIKSETEKESREEVKRFARLWNLSCEERNRPELAWHPNEVRGWSSKLSTFIRERGVAQMSEEDIRARLRLFAGDLDWLSERMSPAFMRYNRDGLLIESFVRYSTKLWLAVEKRLREEIRNLARAQKVPFGVQNLRKLPSWPLALGHRHPEGVEVQMNRLIPKPTPQDIEATLTAMRNDTSVHCLWLGGYLEEGDLWWVTTIRPNGERSSEIGCGRSSAEAAAVAWINYVFISDEDFAHVPEGFQFELRAAPVPDRSSRAGDISCSDRCWKRSPGATRGSNRDPESRHQMSKAVERKAFFERVEAVFGSVPLAELSDDDLTLALTVAQYATDLALVEAERRGLITEHHGVPIIPFELPEGVEFLETLLTRPE